jgi:hypothetical protein
MTYQIQLTPDQLEQQQAIALAWVDANPAEAARLIPLAYLIAALP